jgi:single-stranded DNA-binding protein
MVVLEQKKGTFTNFIPVEFLKDACDAVDELSPGDQIEVTYRLSGRRWQRDEASEAKYFLSAEAISFKRLSAGGRADDGPDDAIDINDDLAAAGADDVPF